MSRRLLGSGRSWSKRLLGRGRSWCVKLLDRGKSWNKSILGGEMNKLSIHLRQLFCWRCEKRARACWLVVRNSVMVREVRLARESPSIW